MDDGNEGRISKVPLDTGDYLDLMANKGDLLEMLAGLSMSFCRITQLNVIGLFQTSFHLQDVNSVQGERLDSRTLGLWQKITNLSFRDNHSYHWRHAQCI